MRKKLSIHCEWDNEVKVWVATSDDLPGLAIEADSIDCMNARLRTVIPELLQLNNSLKPHEEIPYHLHSDMDCIAYA